MHEWQDLVINLRVPHRHRKSRHPRCLLPPFHPDRVIMALLSGNTKIVTTRVGKRLSNHRCVYDQQTAVGCYIVVSIMVVITVAIIHTTHLYVFVRMYVHTPSVMANCSLCPLLTISKSFSILMNAVMGGESHFSSVSKRMAEGTNAFKIIFLFRLYPVF